MNRDKNFEKLMQKGEVPNMVVNDGFTPINGSDTPASTVNSKTGTGKPNLRGTWAIR